MSYSSPYPYCGYYYLYVAPFDNPHNVVSKRYLPLVESEIHTTILDTSSRTTLQQEFKNPSKETIKNCQYLFPLYDGVSVVSFTCHFGSQTLTGIVKEKVEAKLIFDDAVSKGKTAGLFEQSEEASDVFKTSLGNIPPKESVLVDITYVGELKNDLEFDGVRFTIPTVIAPRYGSGPATSVWAGDFQDAGSIRITVDALMPDDRPIKSMQSPSHPISVSMGVLSSDTVAEPRFSQASATLAVGKAALGKDFVLIVQAKDSGNPRAFLEAHPTIKNQRALMATLVPKFSLPQSKPEIVFVADRSGSMRGKIPMLISAMNVFLKSLPTGIMFNVCSFGNDFSFLWDKSQAYTKESLNQALDHVRYFSANMGGTETLKAIRETVNRRFTDLPLEIILLTDGDIWQQEEAFNYVSKQANENASGKGFRLFPLGIGSGVSHAFIEGLARSGNGFAQSVQDGERIDSRAVRMLRGALSPQIWDYSLEVKYETADDFEIVEKVVDSIEHLLIEDESPGQSLPKRPQTKISLFDPSVDPDNVKEDSDLAVGLPALASPKLLQAPHRIPALYSFSRTTVYLLMSPDTVQQNPVSATLRASSIHGPLELEIPIEILPQPGETIHQLAARKAVQDFEEGRGWIYDVKDNGG